MEAGTPASELAVLYRVNAQSEAYERALADAGVPYVLRGGERFFDRTEIREAMLLLRGAVHSTEFGEKLADIVRDVLSALSWSPGAPPAGGSARERWESLAALVAVAEELTAVQPDAGLGDFVAELEQRVAAQHAPTVQGVTLASLHAAKGLEWDAVFLVGLVDGTLPIQHALTDEQVDEERRLLYVGVTRARESVALSWALSRAPGGRRSRRRTRFLHGIAPEPGAARIVAGRRRGSVGLPDGADEELFGRLRAWRSARAEAQKVPAYVVFTDATLTELAVRQPADVPELVAVPGIGQSKLDRYGEDVLAIVRGEPAPSGAGG
jgi:DNA helicase-2/ATP-dependent DNA helicase PcrA